MEAHNGKKRDKKSTGKWFITSSVLSSNILSVKVVFLLQYQCITSRKDDK